MPRVIDTREELEDLIKQIKKEKGEQKLSVSVAHVDLVYFKFEDLILDHCSFYECNLESCDFDECLCLDTHFFQCNLSGSCFSRTTLNCCVLKRCDCIYTNFRGAEFQATDFEFSNLAGANFKDEEKIRQGIILQSPMIGYKKLLDGSIATLYIPEGAIVFSINNAKCRTNKAEVRAIKNKFGILIERGLSFMDNTFIYEKGKTYTIENFDLEYNKECASGIHFFRTEEEAKAFSFN